MSQRKCEPVRPTMIREHYDLVVVGATTAGISAAKEARRRGLATALLDPQPLAFAHEIRWTELHRRIGSLTEALACDDSLAPLRREAVRTIWRAITAEDGFRSNADAEYPCFTGAAKFVSPSRVDLASGQQIHAGAFIIATGAEPRRPSRFDFSWPAVRTSHSILRDPSPPLSVVILGADWLGCEWASLCASAGSEVVLVDRRTRLLRALDADVRIAVQTGLHEMGVVIVLDEELVAVTEGPHGECHVELSSGREEIADRLLVLAGKTGNTRDLGLEELAVDLDPLGHVLIDDCFQSSVEGILAIGSVADPMGLAASGRTQAHMALDAVLGRPTDRWMSAPWILRSSLEVGMCGLTEEACTMLEIPVVVGRAETAQSDGGTPHFCKIVVGRADGRILGGQIVGPGASDAIHLASDAVERNVCLEDCIQLGTAAGTAVELYWQGLQSASGQLRSAGDRSHMRSRDGSSAVKSVGGREPSAVEDLRWR